MRVYPFEGNEGKIIIFKLLLYVLLYLVCTSSLLLLHGRLKSRGFAVPPSLSREVQLADMLWVWLSLYLTAVFTYKVIGIPNYLISGDEAYYWNTLLLADGKWDVGYLAGLYAVRGYWCYLLQTVAKYAAVAAGCDPVLVWLVFPSMFIAWLSAIVIPGISRLLFSAQRVKVIQMYFFTAVFLFIWYDSLTSCQMDLFGMVTFFAALYHGVLFWRNRRFLDAACSGGLASVSVSYRLSNVYCFYLVLLVLCVDAVISFYRERLDGRRTRQKMTGTLLCVLSFLILCIPQFAINRERGHFGFLPYDHAQAWDGRSQTEWSGDTALSFGNIGFPVVATDDQMLSMKSALYDNGDKISVPQILMVYMNSPLETLMVICKKLLIGFDVQTNIAYPDRVEWRSSSGMIFSFVNYFILFSGMYILLSGKKVSTSERWAGLLIFLTIVLPQTWMKIEWRYILPGHIYLYYIFSYRFVHDIVLDHKEYRELVEKSNYLSYIVTSIFLMFCFSFIELA